MTVHDSVVNVKKGTQIPLLTMHLKTSIFSPFLFVSFVRVIRLITNRQYAFCVYYVRLSTDNHNPNNPKIDYVLL